MPLPFVLPVIHQFIAKYRGTNDAPTPDGIPLGDIAANRLRGGHAGTPHIVSKWRRLEKFNPKSQESILILTSILDDPADRRATTALRGEDAAVVLDILAGILDRGANPGNLSNRTLGVLRSLAYDACQVPNRYRIDRNLAFDVAPTPFDGGGFAEIHRGRLGDRQVAVKVLRMAVNNDPHKTRKHFCKETVLWKNISHPRILGLIAAEIDAYTGKCSMISDFMVNGNIVEFIRSNPANRFRLLADAAEGLQHLHERKIIHGDIKGNNILITNETPHRACLSDFGLSTFVPSMTLAASANGTKLVGGTPSYMAPELIFPQKFHVPFQLSKEADIYAMGMVMYEIVTGVRPFGMENLVAGEVIFMVVAGGRPVKPENADDIGFGRGVWELVEGCWKEDRTQRPKIREVHQRLTLAASWSQMVPAGVRVEVPLAQEAGAGPMVTSIPTLFDNLHQPFLSTDPGGGGREEGGGVYGRQDAGSILELSMTVAQRVVDGIQASIPPTVREKLRMLDRLPVRRFFDNVRAKLGFNSPDAPRLHQG